MFGRVGLQSPAAGVSAPPRLDRAGRLVVEIGGAKYAEDARRGRLFSVANTAAVALTAALATTYTGLVLGNKAASAKNLELLALAWANTAAVATATALGLMSGQMTEIATNPLTPKNRLIGGPAASGAWASSGGTIGTPTLDFVFAPAGTLATTGYSLGPWNWIDLEGSTILTPGSFAAIYSAAANTATMLFTFLFREVDPEQ
jgi:hypothetical protein